MNAAHLLAVEDRLTALEELVHEHLARSQESATARPWYAWAGEAQSAGSDDSRSPVRPWYAWAERDPTCARETSVTEAATTARDVRCCASCDKARDRGDGFVYCTRNPMDWLMTASDLPACPDFATTRARA